MPQAVGRIAAALVLCVTSWTSLARGAAFDSGDTDWQGCSVFMQVLAQTFGAHRVVATDKLRWRDLQPEDGLIVLHPTQPLDSQELSAFLRAGGRVAILDDFGAAVQNLEPGYGIGRVPAPRTPLQMLRNNPALAIAHPVSETTAGLTHGVHPVVAGGTQIVTNHPTALTHRDLTPVLAIAARAEPDGLLAVAGKVVRGRLFVVSDPSIVINQMMRYPGNRAFASGLARYLVEDDADWGARQGKVYVVANGFEQAGAFGNQSSIAKSLEATVRDASRRLAKARENGLPSSLAVLLAAGAGLMVLGWVVSRASRAYARLVPRFARGMPLVAQGGMAGRAAVLAAPSTHRALALLELKSAFEEAVAGRYALELPVSAETLLNTLRDRGQLGPEHLQSLKALLFFMSRVETSVAAGEPLRVSERALQRAADEAARVLSAIGQPAAVSTRIQD